MATIAVPLDVDGRMFEHLEMDSLPIILSPGEGKK